jgi:YD repeat-containing protein
VDTSGIITTVAGTGYYGYSGDGGPATEAMLDYPCDVATDASGNLYIADYQNRRIRKVSFPSAFVGVMIAGDIHFVEKNGLGYTISSCGRHKSTIDIDTRVTLYEFGYDGNNNLISITDQFGNQTTIERDGNGVPTSITSPDSLITTLTIDANNHLTEITYSNGSYHSFEYTPYGLMTAKIEPEGNRFEHVFDSLGRLTDATDQDGGHWNYARTA